MHKRQKLLFRVSIGLNMLLIAFVVLGYIKMNFAKEQLLLTEVQENLVELEGLIANQSQDHWPEPNLATTELGDILNGIWLSIRTGEQLGTLSGEDKKTLANLYYKLKQYPHDELYRFAELTDKDKENFEKLREILRDIGLGLNIQVSGNMESFMNQAEDLEKKIKAPLN